MLFADAASWKFMHAILELQVKDIASRSDVETPSLPLQEREAKERQHS
jgi:hypothetical protein